MVKHKQLENKIILFFHTLKIIKALRKQNIFIFFLSIWIYLEMQETF